jgi:methionyl-tRNA formyltransferase
MAPVSWERPAREIHNRIRALNPWPLASSEGHGQRVQLLRSRLVNTRDQTSPPGTFHGISTDGIMVQCGEGTILELLEVKLAGKKPVSGRDFANGLRLHSPVALFKSDTGPR